MVTRNGAISSASSFSILHAMLSSPEALLGLMFRNSFATLPAEISMLLMLVNFLPMGSGMSTGLFFVCFISTFCR